MLFLLSCVWDTRRATYPAKKSVFAQYQAVLGGCWGVVLARCGSVGEIGIVGREVVEVKVVEGRDLDEERGDMKSAVGGNKFT